MAQKNLRDSSEEDVSNRPKKRSRNACEGTHMDPQHTHMGVQVFSARPQPPPEQENPPLIRIKLFGFKVSVGRPKFPLFTVPTVKRHKVKFTNKQAFTLFRYLMTGPIRSLDIKLEKQPPRPPNAWILYRSEKLRDPSLKPGSGQRLPQADISKMISQMWKNESEDVRARYEYLANIKKNEHEAKYPGYRYQPMKRVDKERMREQKKLEKEKERAERKGKARVPYSIPYLPAQMATPMSYAATETRYGPGGPSPPLSVAGSPEMPSRSIPPEIPTAAVSEAPIASSSTRVSGSSFTFADSALACGSGSGPLLHMPDEEQNASLEDGYAPAAETSDDTSLPPTQLHMPDEFWTLPGPSSQANIVNSWQDDTYSYSSQADQFIDTNQQLNLKDFLEVSFDIPQGTEQNWDFDLSEFISQNGSTTTQQATVVGTNGPNIFQLGFDHNALLQDPPPGEIEVTMSNAFAQYADPAYLNAQPLPNQHELFSPEYLAELGLDWGRLSGNAAGELIAEKDVFANNIEFDLAALSSPEDMTSPSTSSSASGSSTAHLLSDSIDKLLSLHQQATSNSTPQGQTQSNGMNLQSLAIPTANFLPNSDLHSAASSSESSSPVPLYSSQSDNSNNMTNSQFELALQQATIPLLAPQPSPAQLITAISTSPDQESKTAYVPPSGAINASRRRAAASWKTAAFQVTLSTDEAGVDEQLEPEPATAKQNWTIFTSAN